MRQVYVDTGPFVYCDDDANCGPYTLDDCFAKAGQFLETGDSGGLNIEVPACNFHGDTAAIAARARYQREVPARW